MRMLKLILAAALVLGASACTAYYSDDSGYYGHRHYYRYYSY